MKHKEYQAPEMSIINMNMSTSILAGSGTASDPGEGSVSDEGTADARPTFNGIWSSDED